MATEEKADPKNFIHLGEGKWFLLVTPFPSWSTPFVSMTHSVQESTD